MEIRPGSPSDAEAIARLIDSFQSELTDDPSGAGAEVYLTSVSVEAEREYLSSPRYRYLLACAGPELAGFIAIRDGSHLFHLFVERAHQHRGLARTLWERALLELGPLESQGAFTVNSSLAAVPVYRALGFVPAGKITSLHGISFFPMRCPGSGVKLTMANFMDAESTLQRFVERINAHDPRGIVVLCTANHVFIDSLGFRLSGYEQLEEAWSEYFSLFPDYQVEIESMASRDRLVLACGFASATHAPSQTRWRIPAARRSVVTNGRIAEWQVYADNKPVYELLSHPA